MGLGEAEHDDVRGPRVPSPRGRRRLRERECGVDSSDAAVAGTLTAVQQLAEAAMAVLPCRFLSRQIPDSRERFTIWSYSTPQIRGVSHILYDRCKICEQLDHICHDRCTIFYILSRQMHDFL